MAQTLVPLGRVQMEMAFTTIWLMPSGQCLLCALAAGCFGSGHIKGTTPPTRQYHAQLSNSLGTTLTRPQNITVPMTSSVQLSGMGGVLSILNIPNEPVRAFTRTAVSTNPFLRAVRIKRFLYILERKKNSSSARRQPRLLSYLLF